MSKSEAKKIEGKTENISIEKELSFKTPHYIILRKGVVNYLFNKSELSQLKSLLNNMPELRDKGYTCHVDKCLHCNIKDND